MRPTRTVIALLLAATAAAQTTAQKSGADLATEYEKAQALYHASNFVAALPLFEDLHKQDPTSIVYEERLGMSLLGVAETLPADQNRAAKQRARALFLDCKKRGDDSPLLNTLLEKMGDDTFTGPTLSETAKTPSQQDFAAAEKLFGAGDMKGASALYQKSLAENPAFYEAALYAGDSLFKQDDCTAAGTFYAKAIAIAPDRETAHRYWADCLVKQSKLAEAGQQYIAAFLAQPYSGTTRRSLKDWGALTGKHYAPPAIRLPAGPTANGKPGDMTITLSPDGGTGDMMRGLVYSGTRISWQKEQFAKTFPSEKTYRHSLPEEAAAIRAMLGAADPKENKKHPDPSTQMLTGLDKEGLLECFILLDAPDQGIAQDYAAYRATHRDDLIRYINKYDIH